MHMFLALACSLAPAADLPAPPKASPPASKASPVAEAAASPVVRGDNLAGQVDTSRGEGRRNENIQVNLVDTNAVRELNTRVGATATIVEEFRADRGYFSAEYGNATVNPIHVEPQRSARMHGNLFWGHLNSVFTARSFFQRVAISMEPRGVPRLGRARSSRQTYRRTRIAEPSTEIF
jgi:hypothetical protein